MSHRDVRVTLRADTSKFVKSVEEARESTARMFTPRRRSLGHRLRWVAFVGTVVAAWVGLLAAEPVLGVVVVGAVVALSIWALVTRADGDRR